MAEQPYRKLVAQRLGASFTEVAEIETEYLPVPAADQLLIRNRFAGINAGFDTLLCRGEVPYVNLVPPFDLGVEAVGIVERVGSAQRSKLWQSGGSVLVFGFPMTNAGIQGLYEVCIGVTDLEPMARYWAQFGYQPGAEGRLGADQAQALYGVNSGVRSRRLTHQSADHGLIRLMAWDTPVNEGLGLCSMKVQGNRWATTLTANVMALWNHAEVAAEAGRPIGIVPPKWTMIYPLPQGQPFFDPPVGVRELSVNQPLTRQVLFQRFGYSVPNYGQINPDSALQASQITHMGMVVQDDSQATLRFYDEVLGLLRVQDALESTYETSTGGRYILKCSRRSGFG